MLLYMESRRALFIGPGPCLPWVVFSKNDQLLVYAAAIENTRISIAAFASSLNPASETFSSVTKLIVDSRMVRRIVKRHVGQATD